MSFDIHYCRLCLQKTEGAAKILFKDSKVFTLVTSLFPDMDTSLVINSMLCIECFKSVQSSNLMIETVKKNEQEILLDLQNTQSFEKNICRLCLSNEKLEGAVCLFKNTNEAARHVIEIAIIDLDFDIFRKPVMCKSCWKIVKSIYLFKKKCFATEKILKYYCATNKINSLDGTQFEKVSLSYQEKLQPFSVNLDEDTLLFDINARHIGDPNVTQNIVNPQDMYLNSFTEDKDDVFEEVPYILNTLNVESLKEDVKIEIKEEKVCEFTEININLAADIEGLGRIQQTEIISNASEMLIIKTENVENSCHSIKSPLEPGMEIKETICGNTNSILKKYLKNKKLNRQPSADKGQFLVCDKCDYQTKNKVQLNSHCLLHDSNAELSTRKIILQSHRRSHESEDKTHLALKCQECPYETREEVNVELHLKAHQSKEKVLKCSECYFITTCSNFLKNHMETHQTKPKIFKCRKCNYVSKTRSNLKGHMLIHQYNCNFQCYTCGYKTKRKSNLVSHMLIHQENYKFSCDKCSYQTKRNSQLVSHMLIHQENYNFQCDQCSYRAKIRSHLVSHIMSVHQQNYNFSCDKCSYWAKTKSKLVKHMVIHQENYNFSCDNCGYQAKRKSQLVNHMMIHQEKYSFSCDKCSYRSKTKSYLAKHMLIHQESYKFLCDQCSYQAKTRSNLVKHMLVHQENYNFPCDTCSYQAKTKSHLVTHMLVHQENYNFSCDKCSYRSKTKSNLVPHMLVHEENYNFSCDKCSYRSRTKSNLVRHMLVHQKNYNFSCDKCSYQTKAKSQFVRHMLKHQVD